MILRASFIRPFEKKNFQKILQKNEPYRMDEKHFFETEIEWNLISPILRQFIPIISVQSSERTHSQYLP